MGGLVGACPEGVAVGVTGRGRRPSEAPPGPRKALFRVPPRPAIRKGFAECRTGPRSGRPRASTDPTAPGISAPGRPWTARTGPGPPEQRKGLRYDLFPTRVNRRPERFPRPTRGR
ncbi:hypothetical protein GCM10010495_67960 [Kitasatospora herbaricolor]|nr:hypothetical protein GCM10010495_67960 [Kitasatospora herbaricolor]